MIRTVIFCRVSSSRQDNSRQLQTLQELADKLNYKVVATIATVTSTNVGQAQRRDIKALKTLVQEKKIDVVLTMEISRLGRDLFENFALLEFLTKARVSIYSMDLRMPTLDESGNLHPAMAMLYAHWSSQYQKEKEVLGGRIKSGQEEAARHDRYPGRPKGKIQTKKQFYKKYRKLLADLRLGLSVRKAAVLHNVSNATALKARKYVVAEQAEKEASQIADTIFAAGSGLLPEYSTQGQD